MTAGVVLVTGATGNVGRVLVKELLRRGVRVRAAVTDAARENGLPSGAEAVRFNFGDPETFGPALADVDRVFLLRPPHLSDAKAFAPFVSAMEKAGTRHVVFLSLMGVERNPIVPHHGIERLLKRSSVAWTFLRPGFYMQNLSTTHLEDIRDRGEIIVPAGRGTTSFIDVRDIAEAAAVILSEPGHEGHAFTITGAEALSYADAAGLISDATGREVRYTNPSGRQFARHMRELGHPAGFVTVMRGIYLVAKIRQAGGITDDFERLVGRPPRSFAEFARDHAEVFAPAPR